MWIYYNETSNRQSVVVPHGQVVRQGDGFDIYLAFESGTVSEQGYTSFSLRYQIPSESTSRLFGTITSDETESIIFEKLNDAEVTYALKDGQNYDVIHFVIEPGDVITSEDGDLKLEFSIIKTTNGTNQTLTSTTSVYVEQSLDYLGSLAQSISSTEAEKILNLIYKNIITISATWEKYSGAPVLQDSENNFLFRSVGMKSITIFYGECTLSRDVTDFEVVATTTAENRELFGDSFITGKLYSGDEERGTDREGIIRYNATTNRLEFLVGPGKAGDKLKFNGIIRLDYTNEFSEVDSQQAIPYVPMSGTESLGGSFSPGTDAVYNLGGNEKRWRNLYLSGFLTDGLYTISIANLVNSGADFTALPVSLIPLNNNSINLGSSAKQWKNLYIVGSISDNSGHSFKVEDIAEILEDLETQSGVIVRHTTAIENLGDSVTAVGQRLTATREIVDDQTEELLSHSTAISSVTQTAESLTANLQATDTRLTGQIETTNTNVTNLQVTAQGLTSRMTSTESNLDTVTGELNTTKSNVSELQLTSSGLSTRMSSAESNINTVTGALETTNTNVSELQLTSSGLSTRMSSAESNINTVTGTLETTNTNVSQLSLRANGFDAKFLTVEGDIDDLGDDLNETNATVGELSVTSAGIRADFNTYVGTNNARSAAIEADVTGLTSKVGAKTTTYNRATEPTAPTGGFVTGDLWFDTTNNVWKIWNGSQWNLARDSEINTLSSSYSTLSQTVSGISATVGSHTTFINNDAATKTFVNSSIASATGDPKGTLDATSDLGLTKPATTAAIVTALNSHTFTPAPSNNDYCFVINEDDSSNSVYDRFKYSSTDSTWVFEYALNNSSFTAAQWSAINSGITPELKAQMVSDHDAVAQLEVTTDSISQTVESHDTEIGTLTTDLGTAQAAITSQSSRITALETDSTGIHASITSHTTSIATAQTTATNAATAASNAQTTATNAATAASNAQSTADDAASAAEDAQSTADGAQTTASNAATAASNAQTTATNAATAASNAQSTADGAASAASSAATAASNAQSTADSAATAASNAQTTADGAQTTATNAATLAASKTTTYRQSTAPETPHNGDLWFYTGTDVWGNVTVSSFTTTTEYVGYYVEVDSVKTLVTTANKDKLSIVAGTTAAYSLTRGHNKWYIYQSANTTWNECTDSGLTETVDTVSSLSIEVGSIKSTVQTISGNYATQSQITQLDNAIALKADTTTVESLDERVSNKSKVTRGTSFPSGAATGDLHFLTAAVTGYTANKWYVYNGNSAWDQCTDGELTTVSSKTATLETSVDAISGRVEDLEDDHVTRSEFTQHSNQIAAKVNSEGGSQSSFGWTLTSSGFDLWSNSAKVFSVTSSATTMYGIDLSFARQQKTITTYEETTTYYYDASIDETGYKINTYVSSSSSSLKSNLEYNVGGVFAENQDLILKATNDDSNPDYTEVNISQENGMRIYSHHPSSYCLVRVGQSSYPKDVWCPSGYVRDKNECFTKGYYYSWTASKTQDSTMSFDLSSDFTTISCVTVTPRHDSSSGYPPILTVQLTGANTFNLCIDGVAALSSTASFDGVFLMVYGK